MTISLIGSVVLVAVLSRNLGLWLFLSVAVLGLLSLQTLRGRGWARWVLAAIAAIAGVGNAYNVAIGQAPTWLSIPLAVVYLACAGVLAFSPPVRRFQEAQRKRES